MEAEIKTNQIYSYTGSVDYVFDNISLDAGDGKGFRNSKSGAGGIDAVPYDGATVTLKSGIILSFIHI